MWDALLVRSRSAARRLQRLGGFGGPRGSRDHRLRCKLIAEGQSKPRSVTLDGRAVYWANMEGNSVRRAPLAGGAALTLAQNQGSPLDVTLDDEYVDWTNFSSNSVMRVPK